jgi:signal transduction histidine kinase/ActR/RegA family two-component response regulator
VLAALGRLAVGGVPIDALLARACQMVSEPLSVEAAVLLVPAVDADKLVVRAASGCLSGAAGEEVACVSGWQAGAGLQPGDAFWTRHGLAASALAVLPGPSGLLGVAVAGARTFEPDELAFLDSAATWLSAAMDRHRFELECQRLYARLAASDRMVSLGTLASGVAHELNNPLSYVTANLAFVAAEGVALAGRLEAASAGDPEAAESARQIVDAAADARDGVEQMCKLVRDLQTLASGDDEALEPLDPTHVLECSINVASSELKHRARIELQLAPSLPPVRANAARLGQVFLNLLINAAHAIPEGHANEHVVRVHSFTRPGDRVAVEVEVEVSDSGGGIPAGQLERLFEPFSGAAAPGPGAGLGLSTCRSIVTALGGELQVTSQAGKGISFLVLFPVTSTGTAEPHPDRAAPPARRHRILVVDDEPLVGTIIARSLSGEFDVVPVGGAAEALDLLARGEKFDVIFSDLLMPGMTGMDLHRELGRLDPGLASKMVFLSGGAFTEAARDFLARPGVECIGKPFDLATLRGAVARRLDHA